MTAKQRCTECNLPLVGRSGFAIGEVGVGGISFQPTLGKRLH
jgi:hypothetical protein